MNKFTKQMSDTSNATLQRRASVIATQGEIAQQSIVNSLMNQQQMLKASIINLTDFAPNDKDSLRPGNPDWDSNEWAKELQRKKWELWMVEHQLKIAKETQKEYFEDEDGSVIAD